VAFVFLEGEEAVLAARLAKRHGHFMPPSLLASQLATLEAPGVDEPVITVNIDQSVGAQIDAIEAGMSGDRRLSKTRCS
jgi:gluconokinase